MSQLSETDAGFKATNDNYMKKLNELKDKKENLPTFSVDSRLPPLPLPELSQTLRRYLRSVKPHTTDIEYMNTEKIVSQFENGIGKKLHYILKHRAERERNWVRIIFI